jgi:NADH dehydrogenase [ubiquinone] 1 alpha subcomplex assembly factor 7
MTPLDAIIREEIKADGPMTLARFMDLALQHPEYGYYRTRDPLGLAGDFVTSPEISQMFGEMIGLWASDLWRGMGKPDSFMLFELGPGRGTLMQDALRATRRIEGFHKALKLYLLESSPVLRKQQGEKLHDFAPFYCESLDDLPDLPLVVIANEFFDALPIRQFKKDEEGWKERLVGCAGGRLVFLDAAPQEPFRSPPPDVTQFWEEAPASLVLMHEIAEKIAKSGGGALIVDYGYNQPSDEPTFQAVRKQAYADPLENCGESDLTAHVNFAALGRMAEQAGLRLHGPVGQGAFLMNMGIELRAAQLKHNATPEQVEAIDIALHRLTDGSEMGSLFKALAVTHKTILENAGFI